MKRMENLSRVFLKQKRKKRLSSITQFKIEFLLPFTGCGKVLGRMTDIYIARYRQDIKTMHWYQIFNKRLWKQSNGTSVAYHHVILPSKFIGKSLLKCLHLEMSSGFLFRRFIPLFVAISNFSFNQRLHLSIARFTEAHFCTIFLSNFCVVFLLT